MENKTQIGMHNEFDVVVTDVKTGKVKQKAKGYNIILNQFWTYFISNGYPMVGSIYFGSGTTPPVVTNTTLTTPIDKKSTTDVSTDTSTFYEDGVIKIKKTIRLEAGEYTGYSISEVGFGSYLNLGTHSLLKDTNGNALTIEIGATDVVDIYGTFYTKFNSTNSIDMEMNTTKKGLWNALTQVNGKFAIYKSKYYSAKIFPFSMMTQNQQVLNASTSYTVSYDAPNKKITLTVPNLIPSVGNIGGLKSINLDGLIVTLPQASFTQPVIVKESLGSGNGTKKDFKPAFPYIMDNSTAKLYVNDVEVSASFDFDRCGSQCGGLYYAAGVNVISVGDAFVSDDYIKGYADIIFENPAYEIWPLVSFVLSYGKIYASNDMSEWDYVGNSGSVDIYGSYRYWKISPATEGTAWQFSLIKGSADCTANLVVHADTPPADGSTVTLTYQPSCIAKDSNHIVNNVKVEISFNEYTPT